MSSVFTGAVLGLALGSGLCLLALSLLRSRRPALADRVVPYLQDLPQASRVATRPGSSAAPATVG
ncbi:MAG: pilus assembly protein TadB, partial [Actinobacteria bacterium]|nr:pilus assembly protein TadB [Actinomycetota bacterium]